MRDLQALDTPPAVGAGGSSPAGPTGGFAGPTEGLAGPTVGLAGPTGGFAGQADGPRLTEAEARVATAIANGLSNREAAQRLFVSVKTIEFHLGNIFRKLGVRNRTELATRRTRIR
ncbi:helix-turn-helix transcriptional regulator [Micromonospora rifamycinica]